MLTEIGNEFFFNTKSVVIIDIIPTLYEVKASSLWLEVGM